MKPQDAQYGQTEGAAEELLAAPKNETTQRIFIAATRMNDGKTTTSLALFAALRRFTERVGFIKPIGQRFIEHDGHQIDEDSVLLNRIFDVPIPLQAMSPIAIHPSFTREYLESPNDTRPELISRMCKAFDFMVHLQTEKIRQFYGLDALWKDAPELDLMLI